MIGMITRDESNPPPTMMAPMRGPRIYPTPNNAADKSIPTWPLGKSGMATSTFPGQGLSHLMTNAMSAPAPRPWNTVVACAPPTSLATSTSAQAVPSG